METFIKPAPFFEKVKACGLLVILTFSDFVLGGVLLLQRNAKGELLNMMHVSRIIRCTDQTIESVWAIDTMGKELGLE
jgi:hypothetical protein